MAIHLKDIPRKNKKRVNQHGPTRKLKIRVRDEATEDLYFEQSPEIKSFKEMVAALQKETLPSSDSEATTSTTISCDQLTAVETGYLLTSIF